jgi:hypothetical protein
MIDLGEGTYTGETIRSVFERVGEHYFLPPCGTFHSAVCINIPCHIDLRVTELSEEALLLSYGNLGRTTDVLSYHSTALFRVLYA